MVFRRHDDVDVVAVSKRSGEQLVLIARDDHEPLIAGELCEDTSLRDRHELAQRDLLALRRSVSAVTFDVSGLALVTDPGTTARRGTVCDFR